jgi:high affinity sulfate transporter 1
MTEQAERGVSPLLQGVLPIQQRQIPVDMFAGVTLAALALPEVLGYTKIAGTPVITGLYTMLVPMILYAIFGSSRHLVVSADSATAAILSATLARMTLSGSADKLMPGSPEWLALAGVLALMSAAFLLLARVLRLGFLADFLSRTVLVGFLTGVGIQVALGQVSDLLGLQHAAGGSLSTVRFIAAHLGGTNMPSLAVAAATLAIIGGSKKLSKRIPGALIAVSLSILAGRLLHLDTEGVRLLGAVPSGLPKFGLPAAPVDLDLLGQLLPTAFALFVVILAQSAATSRAFAAIENEQFSENTDLVGLALANMGAAMSGTFVVNGSPTKTQMVESAGGRSQIAQLTSTAVVILVLLFLTGPLAFLPEAALAAIIFLIGVELVDLQGMRLIFRSRRSEFWIALITTLVVVCVGVEQSILLAIILSLMDHTRHGYRPHNSVLIRDNMHGIKSMPFDKLLKTDVSAAVQLEPGLIVYRFSHSIYYANTQMLFSQVVSLISGLRTPLTWFCIDATAIDDVDYTGATTLRAIHGMLKGRGIRLVFAQVSDEVRTTLEAYELTGLCEKEAFFDSIGNVLHAYEHVTKRQGKV